MYLNSCVKHILSTLNSNKEFYVQNICKCIYNQHARSFFRSTAEVTKTRSYRAKKVVGFSVEQMYSVVADVKNYEYFVPFCKKSIILQERPGYKQARLTVGFSPLVENYTSNITLEEPYYVKSSSIEGKLFDHLETTWRFSPALKSNPQSCIIDFFVSFEFKSLLHSHVANLFFDNIVKQMETAFIDEARVRYGKETIASRSLGTIEKR